MTNHGGPRPGAGRKPDPNAAHRKLRPILLNDEELERAKVIGDGNASLGVRRALDRHKIEPQNST